MPVDGVARAAINLTVVGNGNCLRPATRHAAAQLDVTLCEILKAKFAEDLQNLLAGENSQFGHHATASSSMVARIVGSLEKRSSERSSPSRCRPIASRILKASSSKVAACVTTGRSRHSATNWRSPLVMRTWIVRFLAGSPQITVCATTALGRESKTLAGGSACPTCITSRSPAPARNRWRPAPWRAGLRRPCRRSASFSTRAWRPPTGTPSSPCPRPWRVRRIRWGT